MNDQNASSSSSRARPIDLVRQGLRARYRCERRFRLFGLLAVGTGLFFLFLLLLAILGKGHTAFMQTAIHLDVFLDPQQIDRQSPEKGDYQGLIKETLYSLFPEVKARRDRQALAGLVSSGAGFQLRNLVLADPGRIGDTLSLWVLADDDLDMLLKGEIDRSAPEAARRIDDRELAWIDWLDKNDRLQKRFNWTFFTAGDSREPEQAGIRGALVGSLLTLAVTLLLSFPIGVAAAIYLEEFAPVNRLTDFIEVNINNLAAVPSIVFGLLGLAIFIDLFGLPRSSSLVGGLVMTLMTMPVVIIASRAALKSVPPSIREAALGIGASKMQMVMHHVLPMALPGILTGAIIGMARALGETAPLLMIGMVAFIVDIPGHVTDPASALPVQIFLWADSPERGFVERTSAAIIVLLVFLIVMNLAAVIMRRKFERRW